MWASLRAGARPLLKAGKGFCSDINQQIAYNGVWEQMMTFPKRRPYETNIIIATGKTWLADYIVQMYLENKKEYDKKRGLVFTMFGCAYLGAAQWFVYVTLFKAAVPNAIRFANLPWKDKIPITAANRQGWIDVGKQTVLDNFVHYTFIYFPIFYTFKELVQGGSKAGTAGEGSTDTPALGDNLVGRAMDKYQKNFWSDNQAIWMLWIPCDMLIYSSPIWLRLPLNHGVSLAWTMILSFMRGGEAH